MQPIQTRSKKGFLDPRTKILLVFTIAAVVVGGGHGYWLAPIRILLISVPFILFLIESKWKYAAIYAILFIAAYVGQIYLLPLVTGFLGFLLVAFCGIFVRMMPGLAMGTYLISSTKISEFMAAMERMRVSTQITIPLSVVFRFFPTILEEYHAIADAMKMRGISLGGSKPWKTVEYRLVPLMVSCVKIGDELSASALTRGLGAPIRRTNVCKIGFHLQDILFLMLCLVSLCVLIFYKIGGSS